MLTTSTDFFSCFSRSLCFTPKRCSSSTITSPRSRNSMSCESRRWVPMATSTLPSARSATPAFRSFVETKRLNISMRTGKGLEAPAKSLEVLKSQHSGGCEHNYLLAVAQRLESGPHHYFGLAVSDVSAEQAVHRLRALHVPFDVADGTHLVLGLGVLECVLELPLPVAVRGERKPLGRLAGGIEFQQFICHIPHARLDARLGTGPGGAAHAVEHGLVLTRAAKALHQVHARQGDVQLGAAGILQQHVIAARHRHSGSRATPRYCATPCSAWTT